MLDVDASDVPLHGEQERTQFHGYYDHDCYLPLYVFCGQVMLACVLRLSRIDGAKQAATAVRLLTTRQEFGSLCTNPRFVVTTLDLPADALYDDLYCQRGEAENRIREAQLDLFGTRASCHKFLANGLRLMFAALAYTLMQRLREIALAGTGLARATAATIRVRLLKIGAAILRNTPPRAHLARFPPSAAHPPLPRGLRPVSVALTECCPGAMKNSGVRGKSVQNSRNRPFLEQLRRQRPLAIRFACPSRCQQQTREGECALPGATKKLRRP